MADSQYLLAVDNLIYLLRNDVLGCGDANIIFMGINWLYYNSVMLLSFSSNCKDFLDSP